MKKKKESLFNRLVKDETFRKKLDEERKLLDIEYQFAKIMAEKHLSQKDIAKKLGVDKSVVSRDFSGALKKAGMEKLQRLADILDCEFIPLIIPRNKHTKLRKTLEELLAT